MKRELQGCCIKERIEEGDLEDLFIFQKKKKRKKSNLAVTLKILQDL